MQGTQTAVNSSFPQTDKQVRNFSTLSVQDVLSVLETSRQGLSEAEAARRLDVFGANRLPQAAKGKWYWELAQNFIHFFALMLWIGAVLAWFAGLPELAWAIVVVIIVNGFFSYWQEYKAERAAEALQALLPHQVTVRRDGEEKIISAETVVRGDILILSEGETVPADARLISAERLRLDLSSLTGESRPEVKEAVRLCCEAGIRVAMVTGDNGLTAAAIGLMFVLIYVPPVARIFGMSPPSGKHGFLIASFGVILLLLEEARKFFARRQL